MPGLERVGEMKWLWVASEFARKVQLQMRFGELSRAPLKLSRLELREEYAECEWFARDSDPWDNDLPAEIREQNRTFQALHDAITVRQFLFSTVPEIRSATLKVYREKARSSRELIISGSVDKEDEPPPRLSSLVMRAKLYGFQFRLEEGALEPLERTRKDLDFAVEADREKHS